MAIEVELYTLDHIIRGSLETAGERLSDVLNNKTESRLLLSTVEASRLLNVGQVAATKMPATRIEKSSILFAVPVAARDLTHKSMYKRAARQAYEVVVFLPNFELRGTVHLTERFDLRRVLVERTDDYIPLTNATATFVLHPRVTVTAGTIIFNKDKITLVGEPLLTGGEITHL